jgi:hypothetical protein
LERSNWDTLNGVLFAIGQLNEAVLALAPNIPPNLHGELRTWCNEANNRWTSVLMMAQKHAAGKAPLDNYLVAVAAQELKPGLRTVVDIASAQLGPLQSVCRLGMEVGQYAVIVDTSDPSAQSAPGLDEIVAAARALPRTLVGRLPVLEKLVAAASRPGARDPRRILASALKTDRHAQGCRIYGANGDQFFVGNLVRLLNGAIHDSLQAIASIEPELSTEARSSANPKPRWERVRDGAWVGELRVGNQVVRGVRPLAKNVIKVLDAFEAGGWPNAILSPLAYKDIQLRHETIRSLNEGLKLIRFHGDGMNERIKWTWV